MTQMLSWLAQQRHYMQDPGVFLFVCAAVINIMAGVMVLWRLTR